MLPFDDGVDTRRFCSYAAEVRVQVIYVGGSMGGNRGSPLLQILSEVLHNLIEAIIDLCRYP